MVCDDTLRIRNLPKELNDTEKEDFLRHFGATQVKILTSNLNQKSTAFAQFPSKELAKSILLRLHQVSVLNSRLCVEFSDHEIVQNRIRQKPLERSAETNNKKHFKTFLKKLNAWNHAVSFQQPPPPHLKYSYPKANCATINNISHALASLPKFYVQVLHLMNRMNLPPPFSDLPDAPIRRPGMPMVPIQILKNEQKKEDTSESELESDTETSDAVKEIVPSKRKLHQGKAIKRPKFIKPNVLQPNLSAKDKPEDIFDIVDLHIPKKIEVNVSADSLEQIVQQPKTNEVVNEIPRLYSPSLETLNTKPDAISEEELASNRIPESDLKILPVFKNYQAGVPTPKLYIKNIAKSVEMQDLEFIYKRYVEVLEENKESEFNIRLMQEGKMKGQAFVTLDSVELAQKALQETNGYILKDKPLVVVFSRSTAQKK